MSPPLQQYSIFHSRFLRWLIPAVALSALVGVWLYEPTFPVLPSAHMADLTELPRPNSMTFSFAQAEARKEEIFQNQPTGPVCDWQQSPLGMSFSIHVHSDDSLEIDHFKEGFHPSEIRRSLNWLLGPAPIKYQEQVHRASLAQLEDIIANCKLHNEPTTVVITSDLSLADSKQFRRALEILFKPSIRLYYVPTTAPKQPHP